MRRMRTAVWAFGIAWHALPAYADSFAAEVHTEDPACPDQAVFVARIQALSTRAQPAAPSAARFHFTVTFRHAPGGEYTGALRTRDPDGQLSTREVSASSCAEVFTTLAWIAVLHVDPEARLPTADTEDDAEAESAPPAARFDPVPPEPQRESPPTDATEASQPAAPADRSNRSTPVERRTPPRPLLGMEGGLHAAIGPELLPHWGPAFGVELPGRLRARIAGSWLPRATTREGAEEAELEAGGGRLEVAWAIHRGAESELALGWCAEAFAIHARGLAVGRLTRPGDDWISWVGVGPELRAHLGDRWRFEGFVALPSSLLRHRIWMALPEPEGKTLYFEAPLLSVHAAVGVTTRLGKK